MKNLISAAVAVMGVVLSVAAGSLPDGYTEVEYLKGGGGAYINLGTKFTEKDRVDIVVRIDVNETAMVFGSRTSSSANDCFIWGLDSSGTKCSLDFRNTTSPNRLQYVQAGLVGLKLKVVDSAEVRGFYNYDTDETISETTSAVSGTFTTPQNAYLFWASGTVWSQNKFSGKVYSFKVSTNGVNRIDLVPAVRTSDSVAGLYDLVSGTFFTNAGTGNFTAGDRVSPIRLLPIADQTLVPGTPSEPEVIVSNRMTGATWTVGGGDDSVPFEVRYEDNLRCGIATAIVSGKEGGDYEGELLSSTFRVVSTRASVPDGYTEVEYIQGNGSNARIVTSYTPNPSTDRIVMRIAQTRTDVNSSIFCARGGSNAATATWTCFFIANDGYRFDRAREFLAQRWLVRDSA